MEDIVHSSIRDPLSQPKSILKKSIQRPAVPPNVNIPAPTTDQAARHLQTALSYAHQIQARKALQAEILEQIEALSLLPEATPPSIQDVQAFKPGVASFQPSDYHALLEERNVNGFCGYTLCANPPAPARRGMEWVKIELGRRFCGTDCARKAMYVRAQLDETPAWERRGGLGPEIVLKEESSAESSARLAQSEAAPTDQQAQLAHERGESPADQKSKLVTDDVVERQHAAVSTRSDTQNAPTESTHESIDGHSVPVGRYKATRFQDSPEK